MQKKTENTWKTCMRKGDPNTSKKKSTRKKNRGKLIMDATVVPSDIKYPTDTDILNQCREHLETAYAFAIRKPVLFINTPMKIANPNYAKVISEPLNLTMREKIGIQLAPENADQTGTALAEFLSHAE